MPSDVERRCRMLRSDERIVCAWKLNGLGWRQVVWT